MQQNERQFKTSLLYEFSDVSCDDGPSLKSSMSWKSLRNSRRKNCCPSCLVSCPSCISCHPYPSCPSCPSCLSVGCREHSLLPQQDPSLQQRRPLWPFDAAVPIAQCHHQIGESQEVLRAFLQALAAGSFPKASSSAKKGRQLQQLRPQYIFPFRGQSNHQVRRDHYVPILRELRFFLVQTMAR